MTADKEIVQTFWDKLDDSPFVMIGSPEQKAHHEPMTAHFDRELSNRLFIYLADDNRLCKAIEQGHTDVHVQFVSKGHDFFACLHGRLSRVTDATLIDRFWSKQVEAWFEGGRQDPRLAMVQVTLTSAEMWIAELSTAGKLKLLFGGDIDKQAMERKHAEVRL